MDPTYLYQAVTCIKIHPNQYEVHHDIITCVTTFICEAKLQGKLVMKTPSEVETVWQTIKICNL